MSRRRSPAASGATWALAIVFVALIGACLTRSSLLWGDTSFEHAQDLGERVFAGTYVAARKIYAPRRPAAVRIAVLGDSRFRLGLSEQGLEATLRRASQGIDARVDNLSIFGTSIGDLEVIARHLDRISPSLTIVAVDHLTLLPTPLSGLTNLPGRLLAIGWRDGPAETTTAVERIDRWLRTAWPLYRFREFARAALIDRIPTAAGKVEPEPDRFASPDDFFRWYHPDAAAEVAAAYRSWQREPTLARYEAYLNVVRDDYVRWVRTRTNHAERLEESSDGVRILSHMLDGLTARGLPVTLILPPQNPVFGSDRDGEFHDESVARSAAELILRISKRHAVPVIDARSWLPVEAFFDFDHVFPGEPAFEKRLAEEIARALGR